MNNILYLGSFPTVKLIEESNGRIDSLYRDDEAIISGFRKLENVKIDVVTSPDIASYPKNSLYYRSYYDETSAALMVSSLNLPLLKQIWTIITMVKASIAIIRKNKGSTTVIVPYVVLRHTTVGRILQHLFKNKVKVAIIIPDIFFPTKKTHVLVNRIAENQTRHFDYFILYTEPMASYLGVSNKPHIVIEGYHEVSSRRRQFPHNCFVVTYAGSLNIRYGLLRLLDAMSYIKEKDIELHLYGDGDGVGEIKEIIQKDKRIKYFGRVSKKEATDAIFNASVLINPRNATDGEYVQYSFPSKDIDYLASGVPSILCKLPGMPSEYYGYFQDAGNGSPQELAEAILYLYKLSIDERMAMGDRSRQFISCRMDNKVQARKILDLINEL